VRHYRGDEAAFVEPRTYGSMLEVTHVHLPMMALVLLLLTHLAIFLPWSMRARAALIVATFGFALTGEGAGWLVRFASPAWAPLKVACFLGLECTLGALLVGLGLYLASPDRPGAQAGAVRAAAARGAAAGENPEPRPPRGV
jgi:hydrogenase/urease accessory protein HupE